MAVLTAEEVTNLYLYGSKTVPSDSKKSLIRYAVMIKLFQTNRVYQ